MNFGNLNSLLRSRLINRGIPYTAHKMKDGSFHITVILSGSTLSINVPYIIRKVDGGVLVTSDKLESQSRSLSSAVSIIAKDVRTYRSTLSRFLKN